MDLNTTGSQFLFHHRLLSRLNLLTLNCGGAKLKNKTNEKLLTIGWPLRISFSLKSLSIFASGKTIINHKLTKISGGKILNVFMFHIKHFEHMLILIYSKFDTNYLFHELFFSFLPLFGIKKDTSINITSN